jgi:ATP-dependent helicase/nuclease subunit B
LSLAETPIFRAVAADRNFWPVVAGEVLQLHAEVGPGVPDLRGIDVIVPGWAHAPLFRAALHERLSAAGYPRSIPPRIHTLPTWGGLLADDRVERRVELFAALRQNAWVRGTFGDQPAALWNLAAHVAAACDELTLAAAGETPAFEARLEASLARHFRDRAGRALLPQAQLVLRLWRATLDEDKGTQAMLRALADRAFAATHPVVFVAAQIIPAWTRAWLESLAARVPVRVVQADARATIAQFPVLAAAWPELVQPEQAAAPIAERARAARTAGMAGTPVLLETRSFEDQAITVCEQVIDWLRPPGQRDLFSAQPSGSIALVAFDRLVARRVRALLERAQVLVRDETGWKLSTTSAAGAVMRLLDLGANGFHHRDLLDWLKSPFTLAGVPQKAYLVETVEKVIRSRGIVQGLGALLLALGEPRSDTPDTPDPNRAAAAERLRLLEAHASRLCVRSATLAGYADALEQALGELGMRTALAKDPIGIEVVRVLDDLRLRVFAAPAAGAIVAGPAEFRALLAARFEEVAAATGVVDSPVVMVSLAGAALRSFDAAVLIGADATHLPALPTELLFFSDAVRADLGLEGRREAIRAQAADLVTLLARVPKVTVTWCSQVDDEPRALAPWFARLRAVAAAAGHDPLRVASPASVPVQPMPTVRPAPAALRLPATLSASQYQSLVNCPYQFHARHLLRLRDLEEVLDEPTGREYGLAVHDVLARFHTRWRDDDLRTVPAEQLAASLTAIANEVFDPLIERRPRLIALRHQFAETQIAYLVWLRRRVADGWRFVEGELPVQAPFEVREGLPPVELKGRIDRVDERGHEVEVLDYKTRRRQQLVDEGALAGEDIQLPFYGLVHSKPVTRAAYVYLQRTSDRSDPVGDVAMRQPYAALVDALRSRLRADLQRMAAGAPLAALGNEVVCNWCEMRGLCRRDFWADDEEPS